MERMRLETGTRIGVYEIVGRLGAGGAGEVYRAHDDRLGRDVAIKVLHDPEADPERLARFRREAKILASFAHPHIASVYGLEDIDTHPALVMELIEGPTLRELLRRGPLRPADAKAIARQIALALEAAHDRGIVHRDLKPANVSLGATGAVKVLDFGIAKDIGRPFSADGSGGGSLNEGTPTLETLAGVVRGTPAYMAPEQARGANVDQRADIWAFGCLCYEMISGHRAFPGDDSTEVLAKVLEGQPDWTLIPDTVSPALRRMIGRCLEKDRGQRIHHIADARLELDDREPPPPSRPRLPWRPALALFVAGAALSGLAGWSAAAWFGAAGGRREAVHLHLQGPPGIEALPALASGFAISPDGRTLVQIGVREGVRAMFAFDTTRATFTEISAANPATALAFSPDGRHIAFLSASNRLGTYALGDGERRFLTTGVELTSGLAWCERAIVFSRQGTLWTISPDGGEARPLTTLDTPRGEISHGSPVCLPGYGRILYSSLTAERGTERIEAIGLSGGPATPVLERATAAAWSPTGHLVFQRGGIVWAAGFDPASGRLSGTPIEMLAAGAVASNVFGSAGLALSASGTLVYVPGDFSYRRLVAVARDGAATIMDVPPGRYFNPRVSPDGRRIAFDDDQATIAILDVVRGTKTAFGPPVPGTNYSTWNSDGTRLAFRQFNQPYWATADGRSEGMPVPGTSTSDFPISAGPDPDSVFVVHIGAETSGDIYLVSLTGRFAPQPVVATRGFDGSPHLSADGRWLLYQSDQSGRPEIYVTPYPSMDRRWQVSADGGLQAVWSNSSREIVFRRGTEMLAVSMAGGGSEPSFGKPTVLFDQSFDYGQGVSAPDFDAMADGRFVMIRPEPGANRLHVVLNWTDELRRRMSGATEAR
jgi:eukaryotic-like serine/threonine-protein kinase